MIKDFSAVYWGYLPMTKEPYKAHEKVNAFIGPSGHGKTTIWDGLRLMLGASHFESKRTFSFYVKNSNWAVVRAAFYNSPINGIRPFESARKFKDEVTACCRIYKTDQGSWLRDYYIFDGQFYDIVDLQMNTKAYSEAALSVGKYLETLEECLGVTKEFRNLMAMSPDTVREVVNSSPRDIFHLIFDLKGTKDYKNRYDESKLRLNAQEITIEQAEEEMREAQARFHETKQKAQKFRLYEFKEKEIKETEIKLIKLEYYEVLENLLSINDEIEKVKKNGETETKKIKELTNNILLIDSQIEELESKYKKLDELEEQANQTVTNYTSQVALKELEIEKLSEESLVLHKFYHNFRNVQFYPSSGTKKSFTMEMGGSSCP